MAVIIWAIRSILGASSDCSIEPQLMDTSATRIGATTESAPMWLWTNSKKKKNLNKHNLFFHNSIQGHWNSHVNGPGAEWVWTSQPGADAADFYVWDTVVHWCTEGYMCTSVLQAFTEKNPNPTALPCRQTHQASVHTWSSIFLSIWTLFCTPKSTTPLCTSPMAAVQNIWSVDGSWYTSHCPLPHSVFLCGCGMRLLTIRFTWLFTSSPSWWGSSSQPGWLEKLTHLPVGRSRTCDLRSFPGEFLQASSKCL